MKPYDKETRRTIDREAADGGNVSEDRPFFFFYPITRIHSPHWHMPTSPARPVQGTLAMRWRSVDHNVGLVLEAK